MGLDKKGWKFYNNLMDSIDTGHVELLVYLETFGCQMNENDSSRILGFLGDLNCKATSMVQDADIIIINTCSVRDKAEHKVYSTLGRLKDLKQQKSGLIIGVAGCVAQQLGAKLFKRAPFIDLVFGPHNIHKIKDLVREARAGKKRLISTEFSDSIDDSEFDSSVSGEAVKSFVSVMRGCNNFCSYCIVPYTRGREASRNAADIVREVESLVRIGVKEVTLVGQNVNSYGAGTDVSFPELLRMTAAVAGLKRLRFMTSHPKDLSDDLINLYRDEKKLCRHIHLPIQSGSDAILGAMKRGYTVGQYLGKIDKLRSANPDLSVTTDIIVGFPGETEADFASTMRLMESVRFDNIYSFMYSSRPETAASKMQGQIDASTKSKRLVLMQELQKQITTEKNAALIGKNIEVLVEGPSKSNVADAAGRTTCNRIANFNAAGTVPGQIVSLRITEAYANSLRGVPKDADTAVGLESVEELATQRSQAL